MNNKNPSAVTQKPLPLILSIETSCDETAVALTKGKEVLSNLISSQIKDHQPYGGVVPELASRKHIIAVNRLIAQSLKEGKVLFDQLDAVSASAGPGLVGALMVGMAAAKTLAFALNIPLISINHIEAHIFSVLYGNQDLRPPFICLVVSGGHTMLVKVDDFGRYELLGQTLDDAAGEAFDKIAKLIGLSYPGGPEIEAIANKGDESLYALPRPMLNRADYNFSFSGLKTAVIYLKRKLEKKNINVKKEDLAASFQKAVKDVLVTKAVRAATELKISRIAVVGGVAANNYLRLSFRQAAARKGIEMIFPDKALSTDNAAMVGLAANYYFKKNKFSKFESSIDPNWGLAGTQE